MQGKILVGDDPRYANFSGPDDDEQQRAEARALTAGNYRARSNRVRASQGQEQETRCGQWGRSQARGAGLKPI